MDMNKETTGTDNVEMYDVKSLIQYLLFSLRENTQNTLKPIKTILIFNAITELHCIVDEDDNEVAIINCFLPTHSDFFDNPW